MVTVNFAALLDAFEFTSFGGISEIHAFVDLETGSIYSTSSDMDLELEDEVPENLETSDRYLMLPDKNDLDLGRRLALSFVEQELPDDYDKAASFFHKKGAYARFKELLEYRNALEKWYAFEKQATEAALRAWCEEHGIHLVDATTV